MYMEKCIECIKDNYSNLKYCNDSANIDFQVKLLPNKSKIDLLIFSLVIENVIIIKKLVEIQGYLTDLRTICFKRNINIFFLMTLRIYNSYFRIIEIIKSN